MGKTKTQTVSEGLPKPKKEKSKTSLKKEKGVRVPGLKGGERVVAVGFEVPKEEEPQTLQRPTSTLPAKARPPKKRGKRYLAARTKVEPGKSYPPEEAARLVKETSISRFNGSVELHLVLAKKGRLPTSVELPYPTGKTKRIEIADKETIEKLKKRKIDFDILLASPAMMPKLIPFAKLLGPRGLLPNPKQGTLVPDPERVKKESANERVLQIKTEKEAPLAHLVIAKVNQPESEIAANLKAVISSVNPRDIKKAVISATMGPGIKVAI
jgi:large subunit ribosomal protein L1